MHKHWCVFEPNLKTATIWRREQLWSYREIRASSKRSHRASRGGVNLSCRSRTVTRSSLRYAAADKKWSKFSHCRNWGPVFCAQIPPGSTNQESGSHVLIVRGGLRRGEDTEFGEQRSVRMERTIKYRPVYNYAHSPPPTISLSLSLFHRQWWLGGLGGGSRG